MADDPNLQLLAAATIPRVRDAQFRDIYTNATFTAMGPFDITLTFSKAGDVAGQRMLFDQAAVSMSPQHLKSFCRSIADTLKAYESVFGELQIADADIQPSADAATIEKMLLAAREQTALVRAQMANSAAAANPAASTEKKPPSKQSRGAARKKGS